MNLLVEVKGKSAPKVKILTPAEMEAWRQSNRKKLTGQTAPLKSNAPKKERKKRSPNKPKEEAKPVFSMGSLMSAINDIRGQGTIMSNLNIPIPEKRKPGRPRIKAYDLNMEGLKPNKR